MSRLKKALEKAKAARELDGENFFKVTKKSRSSPDPIVKKAEA